MSPAHELCTLTDALREDARDGRTSAALATVVATHGATFRHAGARMLVRADGSIVCELSGGCPQRDIAQRALRVIAEGLSQLARYNAESGLDVLMEMGCGGELDVLIEPLAETQSIVFFDALASCLENRSSVVIATLFAIDGAVVSPRRALWCDGALHFNEINDAGLCEAIVRLANADNAPRAVTLRLPSAAGAADVLIERIEPPHALFAIGHGATARALVSLCHTLGWQASLVVSDFSLADASDLPSDMRVLCATSQTARETLPLDRYSSVVVMTHNLAQDLAWLDALREAPVAYLGAIGSRERASRMRQRLSPSIANLHAPAGFDIGSETPAEIALAIAAEIIAVINGRRGGSLCKSDGDLHG